MESPKSLKTVNLRKHSFNKSSGFANLRFSHSTKHVLNQKEQQRSYVSDGFPFTFSVSFSSQIKLTPELFMLRPNKPNFSCFFSPSPPLLLFLNPLCVCKTPSGHPVFSIPPSDWPRRTRKWCCDWPRWDSAAVIRAFFSLFFKTSRCLSWSSHGYDQTKAKLSRFLLSVCRHSGFGCGTGEVKGHRTD